MDQEKEKLNSMSKEELVDFIMANKHKLIMNKDKNVPFVDKDGKVHRKEYAD
jgi:hypothetical protein